ncbi:hypothetical protein TrST_g12669 [Triparma strigata]|uniref:ER-bound oxygenase mpaB/mpaB'/Rubber oxygenase catalytic domain-containing protein n=1 Tax=Triparma strigata TaxID=1606541 RepID=A0A9W7BVJ8_9STRA|nr:hypothetical protein TrST_g12669 [Triparma strigata]
MFPAYEKGGSLYAGPCRNIPLLELNPSNIDGALRRGLEQNHLITYLGLRFVWTRQHSKNLVILDDLQKIGDPLADACIAEILASGELKRGGDFLESVEAHANSHPSSSCSDLLAFMSRPPDFEVDEDAVEKGKLLFLSLLPISSLALLHLSLIGGFSAPQINKTLNSTGYLTNSNPKSVRLRLFETFKMISDAMTASDFDGPNTSIGGLSPTAINSITKVRLLHAFVRQNLLKKPQTVGIPINQTELIVTSLSFSQNVLLGIESLLGSPLPPQNKSSYVHLWKTISHYIGITSPSLISSPICSTVSLETILITLVRPDRTSEIAAATVLEAVSESPPFKWPRGIHAKICRKVMGLDLSAALGISTFNVTWKVNIRFYIILSLLKIYSTLVSYIGPSYFSNLNGRISRAIMSDIFSDYKTFNGVRGGNQIEKLKRMEEVLEGGKIKRERRFGTVKVWAGAIGFAVGGYIIIRKLT